VATHDDQPQRLKREKGALFMARLKACPDETRGNQNTKMEENLQIGESVATGDGEKADPSPPFAKTGRPGSGWQRYGNIRMITYPKVTANVNAETANAYTGHTSLPPWSRSTYMAR